MPVLIVLAVRLVVLVVVRDHVLEGEPVVGGDLVDAGPGAPAAALEQIGRRGQPGGELRQDALVALPELTHDVAEAVVELEPAGREVADLIAAGADVPGLGDQLDAAQHPVLPDRAEEAAVGIEAVLLAPERRGEVEAEAVDVHLLDPVAQRVGDHLQHPGWLMLIVLPVPVSSM